MIEPTSAGWYRDPFGRHERRYHTGTGWTEHVRDRGRAGIDPPCDDPADTPVSLRIPAPRARGATLPPQAPAGNGRPGNGSARSGTVAVADQPVSMADWAIPSNLPPTGAQPPPPAPPRRRARWPWVLLITAGIALGVALGLVLTTGRSDTPRRSAPPLAQASAANTITLAEYHDVESGASRTQLVRTLGQPPASGSDLVARFPKMVFDPACIYYFGETPTRTYTFCFGTANTLTTRRIDSQVARRP